VANIVSLPYIPSRRNILLAGGWAALQSLMLPGCIKSLESLARQGDEPDRERYAVKTLGEVCTVGNAEPVPLGGVGIVTGLDGTGGEPANDGNRAVLEDDLKKMGVKNIKELLSSPDNALVLVSASIPPGARKDDPLDVQVSLPPRTKATSLKGGLLHTCTLYNYDFAQNLKPDYQGSRGALRGHPIARAGGPLLVGFGDDKTGDVSFRQGSLWGGGKTMIDMPLTLVLNPDQQLAKVSKQVADRVNEGFPGTSPGNPGNAPAIAKNNQIISLKVPPCYRHNLPRYLRVVRLIPLTGSSGELTSYRQKLEEDLQDPRYTLVAALRLESLGKESIPGLKRGLENENELVRFCSAEALAYLGSPSCAEELTRCIEKQPILRAYCFTAMASMDEAICQIKLREILAGDMDDETRYGAFRALRAIDKDAEAVAGELMNESFWLHRVAPQASPMVHVSTSRRAEIVLFGKDPALRAPFSIQAGDFILTAGEEDERCSIARIVPGQGEPQRRNSTLAINDIIRSMATMGAGYPEALEFIQQADHCKAVTCSVRRDALPRTLTVQELAKIARQGKTIELNDEDLIRTGSEPGALPGLFDSGKAQAKAR